MSQAVSLELHLYMYRERATFVRRAAHCPATAVGALRAWSDALVACAAPLSQMPYHPHCRWRCHPMPWHAAPLSCSRSRPHSRWVGLSTCSVPVVSYTRCIDPVSTHTLHQSMDKYPAAEPLVRRYPLCAPESARPIVGGAWQSRLLPWALTVGRLRGSWYHPRDLTWTLLYHPPYRSIEPPLPPWKARLVRMAISFRRGENVLP